MSNDVVCHDKMSDMARRNPLLRFYEKVALGDGCWEWQATGTPAGYGLFRPGGKAPQVYAHRWAWEYWNGPIPERLWVLHHCDNPRCVRQDHLYVGDHAANIRDKVARDRQSFYWSSQTHCRRGHPFDEQNTRTTMRQDPKRGSWVERACRTCQRDHMRRYRAARRG